MARTGIKLLVLLALAVFVIAPQHAAAQCLLGYANGFASPGPLVNNEGLRERAADITITTGVAANCFSAGNVITATYNGILSYPQVLSNTSQPQYIVITNPLAATDGTLTLGVTTTSGISVSGPQTVIQMTVLGATTDPGASISLQNLRFDLTGLAAAQLVPTPMNAFVSGSSAGLTAVAHEQVGQVLSTIRTASQLVIQGLGQQSSGGTLGTPAAFAFGTAPGWTISAFRVANAAPKYPLGCPTVLPVLPGPCTDTVDNPTTSTSLVIDVENIPSGVTVTMPGTLSIWGGGPGSTIPTWQWTLKTTTTNNSTGAAGTTGIQGLYETTIATGTTFASFPIYTGATAADSTPGTIAPPVPGTPPTIGVVIGSSSGSGIATLRVVFGPGGNPPNLVSSAAFPGDDFNGSATAAPTYTPSISTSGEGREIITDSVIHLLGVDTAPTAWFTITPTQSAVLYQYATDRDGYQTGLAIGNTGNDSTIFKTKGQTGPVVWYLFPNGATAPIIYQTKSGDGTGLDANGNLEPGNVLAITLDELLTAAGQPLGTFSGYVIAVGEFNYGHGYDIVVDSTGRFTAQNALFLGSAGRNDVFGAGLTN